eukprot:3863628-Amphidinium_carterae.1
MQFECIRRAMLDYLRGQRNFDLRYWQGLMATEKNRKWIRVYKMSAMAQTLESFEVDAPSSDLTEESLAECCEEAMKQIAKKIPLAVARTNIWDLQSPPRSMQFGAFTQRGVGITRCTWEEPELLKALHKVAEFRPKHLLPAYLTISLNEYTTLKLHVDKHNRSSSIVIAFGDFTGGELWVEREGGEHHPPP